MSKKMKKLMLICATVFGIGIICVIIGVANDGLKQVVIKDIWGDQDIFVGRGELEKKQEELEAFNSVEVDISFGDIELIPTDNQKYIVECLAEKDFSKINISNVDGKLYVSQNTESKKQGFLFGFSGTPKVKIYYPKGKTLDYATLKTEKGDIAAESVNVKTLTIDSDLGDIEIDNLLAQLVSINTDLGDIAGEKINVSNLTAITDLGDVEVEGVAKGQWDISTNLGDVDVKIHGAIGDFDYDVEGDFGTEINGQKTKNKIKETGAPYKIKIRVELGDGKIDFV